MKVLVVGTGAREHAIADALKDDANMAKIIKANKIDIDNAKNAGMKESLIDRLSLNEARISSMAEGILEIVNLDDPVGEVTSMKIRPNGLQIGCKRVPIGVIGIIYESFNRRFWNPFHYS